MTPDKMQGRHGDLWMLKPEYTMKPQDQMLTCVSLNFIKLLTETWVPVALCPQLDLLVSSKMQTFIQDFSPVGIGHTYTYSHAEHG